ncbi:MAG: NTP transferase domain-containing protein [Tissierella sp.]|nr:NTP transferase domain-containing protein [Tissierella sp.]
MNIETLLINEDFTLIEAMETLDKIAKKVLFVAEDRKLVATLTDGDVRRWILKKGSLDSKITNIANYKPKFLLERDKVDAKSYMKKYSIEALPIVDEEMRILSVVFLNDTEISIRKEIKLPVVIMAGGLGTRLYPYTIILPKPLIPVGEIPIAEHLINRFNKYGCRDFYLIVNHKKNMIKAYFNEVEKDYTLNYIDEDKPLGTGGGLSLLKGRINSTFILSNCDILIDQDYEKIYQFHKKEKNLITMVCSLKTLRIPYGVIDIGENGEIENIKEKPELSFFTNTGFYIVEPSVIDDLEEDLVIGFPDIVEKYRNLGGKIGVFPISENSWLDMGQLDELEKMRRRLNYDG